MAHSVHSTFRCTYDGSITVTVDEQSYIAYGVHAEATGWEDSGFMYYDNGDPGEPPDGEFNVKSVDVGKICRKDGDTESLVTDETIIAKVKEAVDDYLYEDPDCWNYDEEY